MFQMEAFKIQEENLFQLLNSAAVCSVILKSKKLFIQCLDCMSGEERKFTIYCENLKRIYRQGEAIDRFDIELSEGEIINYEVYEHSLKLIINWVSYEGKGTDVVVYNFYADKIYIIFDWYTAG